MEQTNPNIITKTCSKNFNQYGDLTMIIDASTMILPITENIRPIFEKAGVKASSTTIQKFIEIVGEKNIVNQVTYSIKGMLPYCFGNTYQISYEIEPMRLNSTITDQPVILTGVKTLNGDLITTSNGRTMSIDLTSWPENLNGFPRVIKMKGIVGQTGDDLRFFGEKAESLNTCDFLSRGGWSDLQVTISTAIYVKNNSSDIDDTLTVPKSIPDSTSLETRESPLPSRPYIPENPAPTAIIISRPAPVLEKKSWSFWQIFLMVLMIIITLAAIGGFIYAITRPTKSRAILATDNTV
jgi:hypothetical protein